MAFTIICFFNFFIQILLDYNLGYGYGYGYGLRSSGLKSFVGFKSFLDSRISKDSMVSIGLTQTGSLIPVIQIAS